MKREQSGQGRLKSGQNTCGVHSVVLDATQTTDIPANRPDRAACDPAVGVQDRGPRENLCTCRQGALVFALDPWTWLLGPAFPSVYVAC